MRVEAYEKKYGTEAEREARREAQAKAKAKAVAERESLRRDEEKQLVEVVKASLAEVRGKLSSSCGQVAVVRLSLLLLLMPLMVILVVNMLEIVMILLTIVMIVLKIVMTTSRVAVIILRVAEETIVGECRLVEITNSTLTGMRSAIGFLSAIAVPNRTPECWRWYSFFRNTCSLLNEANHREHEWLRCLASSAA